MIKENANESKSIFDKCKILNKRLTSYMKGIEGLLIKQIETTPANQTEKYCLDSITNYMKTVLSDLMILKDFLYEVESCGNDKAELQFLMDMFIDSENH